MAYREGVANCTTSISLKANGKFYERSMCFGVDKTNGVYSIAHDTVYFAVVNPKLKPSRFQFGVIKKTPYKNNVEEQLLLYGSAMDSVGTLFNIRYNHL